MSITKKYVFILAYMVFTVEAWGQASSPFSSYGIGEYYGNALAHNQGMAGIGVSQPQFWYLNNQNPALLVYNSLTVFQAGIVIEQRKISSGEVTEKQVGGNMNYLATAFPVKPGKWTTSLGLMPYTSVNYKIQSPVFIIDVNNVVVDTASGTVNGSGGLTQLYWSNGVRINRNFAVGLKATYLFSSIETIDKALLPDDVQPLRFLTGYDEKTNVKDFTFDVGVSFSKDSLGARKNYRLSIGAVYGFATDLKARKTDKLVLLSTVGDTLISNEPSRTSGFIHLPSNFTGGISLSRGSRWTVGTEFSYRDWSSFRSINKDQEGLGKSWRVALGAEITPDPVAIEKYLKRITYRTGVSVEQYPFFAGNNKVKDVGINFGLSLPTGRSSLDLAVKFGKRGNKNENILEENYFKIYFGITFNDQWFIKRKFD
ncbi:MAG: hypothetical protein ACOYXT_02870 [Bacteroidota bacterium]